MVEAAVEAQEVAGPEPAEAAASLGEEEVETEEVKGSPKGDPDTHPHLPIAVVTAISLMVTRPGTV